MNYELLHQSMCQPTPDYAQDNLNCARRAEQLQARFAYLGQQMKALRPITQPIRQRHEQLARLEEALKDPNHLRYATR